MYSRSELCCITEDYELGEILDAIECAGYTNQSIRIDTTTGKYVLRTSRLTKSEKMVAFETEVLRKLRKSPAANFVVEVVAARNGSPFVLRDARIHTLFKYVSGEQWFYDRWNRHRPDMQFVRDFGGKCAILHESLAMIKGLDPAKETLPAAFHKMFEELQSVGLPLSAYRSLIDLCHGDSLLHTDLRIKNLIVNRAEVTTVLDFDDVTYGNQLYDLAWCIKECFSLLETASVLTPMINGAAAIVFLEAYQSEGKGRYRAEDIVKLMMLACIRAVHFLHFGDHQSVTPPRIEKLKAINLAQLEFFSRGEDIFE